MNLFAICSKPIEIEAPAELVWEVLMDTARYGEWNPFTPEVDTTFEISTPARLRVRMWPGHLRITEFVCAVEKPRLLAWNRAFGARWLLFSLREQHIVTLGENLCSYHNIDRLSGLLAPLVRLTLGAYVRRGFTDVGKGLKNYAENHVENSNSKR